MAALEVLLVMIVLGVVAAFLAIGAGRTSERRQNIRLLATHLREGRLDEPTREHLVAELLGRAGRGAADSPTARRHTFDRFSFVLGWVIFTVGVALLVTGARDVVEGGIFLTIFGLGVVGLPMVLREYDERIGARRG